MEYHIQQALSLYVVIRHRLLGSLDFINLFCDKYLVDQKESGDFAYMFWQFFWTAYDSVIAYFVSYQLVLAI